MQTLTNDVYYVGVLNPNMRVFDIEMRTEYGTSYNSYVVCGAAKTAVIDANHATFAQDWLARVEEALCGRQPDYLILNHTEPDHSGAVHSFLAQYPHAVIACSAAAAINIKNITNRTDLAVQVVKDGDSLDLGGLTLQFISAPFLHWPDTMFTWLPERKLLFSCDFLGAHFCEPRVFDHRIIYHREFSLALREYYDSIMAPFASWVQKGLDKLEALDPDIVATSHGPVLTRGCDLKQSVEHYRRWSAGRRSASSGGASEPTPLKISLFYCSAYGNTRALATHIAKGIRSALPTAEVVAHDLIGADLEHLGRELNNSDAFLLGSPTINKSALPVVWNLVAEIDAINIPKRPAALFGSYGWSGEAVPHLAERLTTLKAAVFEKQLRVQLVPSKEDLAAAENFGVEFAEGLR